MAEHTPLALPNGYKLVYVPNDGWSVLWISGPRVSPVMKLTRLKDWIYDHWQELERIPILQSLALRDNIIKDLRNGEY